MEKFLFVGSIILFVFSGSANADTVCKLAIDQSAEVADQAVFKGCDREGPCTATYSCKDGKTGTVQLTHQESNPAQDLPYTLYSQTGSTLNFDMIIFKKHVAGTNVNATGMLPCEDIPQDSDSDFAFVCK